VAAILVDHLNTILAIIILEAHHKPEEQIGVSISFQIITDTPGILIVPWEDPANQIVAAMILVVTGVNMDMIIMGIISQHLDHPIIIRDESKGLQVDLFNSGWRLLSMETTLKLLSLYNHVPHINSS
jgi:hypothetical protein